MSSSDAEAAPMRVLVYSDDRSVRDTVRWSLGTRPDPDLPAVEIEECATAPAVWKALDAGGIDLAILDGEAAPAGGMGISRQVKDEIYQAPPVLVLIGRPQDAWLATWSRAEAVVAHPIDAIALARTAAMLLRRRVPARPASS
jgi:DNA-binding response OmpR family regulator